MMSALKDSMLIDCNFRYLIVCGMVRLWLDGICNLATTEKWSEIKSEAETERTLHPKEQIIVGLPLSRETMATFITFF